jgi:hypothetical protein
VAEPLRGQDEKEKTVEPGVDLGTDIRGNGAVDIRADQGVRAAVGGEVFGVGEVGVAPMRAKARKARSKKVLDFTALKRAKQKKKSGQLHPPSRGQDWMKSILPSPKAGAWWECPADDKGFKIKLRWRAGGKKPVYAFARLGKRELEELKEKTYEEQKQALSGRIFRELYHRGERAVAARITPYAGNRQNAGGLGG